MTDRAKDRFIKVAVEGVRPEKFHRQSWRTDERPENPAKLAAEKQIAGQPGDKDFAGDAITAAQGLQQPEQANIRCDAGEGDDDDLRKLNEVVSRPGDLRLSGQRRRVPDDKEHDRRE